MGIIPWHQVCAKIAHITTARTKKSDGKLLCLDVMLTHMFKSDGLYMDVQMDALALLRQATPELKRTDYRRFSGSDPDKKRETGPV